MTDVTQTIVIADDEPAIAELLTFTLTRRGYTVRSAGDGEAAWQLILLARPALVILDVMMPKLSGFDLAQRMLADPTLATIPIIMASGGLQPQEMGAGAAPDARHYYIAKPFSPRELGSLVDSILRGGGAA